MAYGGLEQGVKFIAVCKLHVFVAEVELELHQGNYMQHLVPHLLEFPGESSFQLVDGNAVGCCVLGCNQVGDGLCLGEVHLSVHKCAAGEFPRFGSPGSGSNQHLHDCVGDVF